MYINNVDDLHRFGVCNVFYPLNKEELEIFAKNGIDGDALRKISDNTYVNTFFKYTYTISKRGKIEKLFSY